MSPSRRQCFAAVVVVVVVVAVAVVVVVAAGVAAAPVSERDGSSVGVYELMCLQGASLPHLRCAITSLLLFPLLL